MISPGSPTKRQIRTKLPITSARCATPTYRVFLPSLYAHVGFIIIALLSFLIMRMIVVLLIQSKSVCQKVSYLLTSTFIQKNLTSIYDIRIITLYIVSLISNTCSINATDQLLYVFISTIVDRSEKLPPIKCIDDLRRDNSNIVAMMTVIKWNTGREPKNQPKIKIPANGISINPLSTIYTLPFVFTCQQAKKKLHNSNFQT